MTKQGLEKQTQKIEYAKRIREILDEAGKAGLDEESILELVTAEDEE